MFTFLGELTAAQAWARVLHMDPITNNKSAMRAQVAMDLARKNGAVFAGANKGFAHGSTTRVHVSTIRSLVRAGRLRAEISPDGDMMALPIDPSEAKP